AAIILTESDGSTDVDEFGPTSDSYSLQLTSVPAETVTITVAPDGQLDVGSGPGTAIDLTFAADLTALDPQTVTVTAVNDTLVEGTHSGTINHTVSSDDLVYPTLVVSDVIVSILDDDLLPTLVISDVTVAEDVGTAVITLTLSGRNVYGAGVAYAFSDGSADSSDYSATNGSLTWSANTSGTKTIAALINDDSYGESTETINITLSTPLTATLVDGSGVITITDNDSAPNLDIAKTVALSGTTAWPGDPVTYTLVISNSGGSADNVTVADMLPAALDGQDFTWTGVITANAVVTHTVVATIDTDAGYGTFILNTATASHALSFDSATAGFATIDDVTPPSLTAARLISPTDIITATRRPTFVWEGFTDDISGVISYTLLISSSNDSVSLQSITTAAVMESVFTPTVDLANGVYTWTVRAYDAAGNASAYVTPAATFTITQGGIYLPFITKGLASGPDLVVDEVTATASQVTITLRNAGTEAVADGFWVDAYFNPTQEPTLNKPWPTIAPAGAVWGVTKSLAPGESLTLTMGDAYYFGPPDSSASFPVGATVYVYVDSVNHNTSYGNVKEGNESNNLSTPVISTAGDSAAAAPNIAAPASRAGLPER
ncbi:MAG: DUF11 domain-containing protein, partial [Anaerolineae bacterium]|nr:DUF11 domain-containing protein [Anaerolineae bacterium]